MIIGSMHIIGMTFSIMAACLWAIAVILFKKSGESLSPMALNLLKTTVTLALFIPTLLLAGVDMFPSKPISDWVVFSLSGFFGIALADTLLFMALVRIGAGTSGIVECLYLPFVIFLSFFFLDERLGVKGMIGATLVICGILSCSISRQAMHVTRKNFVSGIFFGITAILLIAASIVMVKKPLDRTHVLWASFARVLAGTLGLYGIALLRSRYRQLFSEFLRSRALLTALAASIIGNYLAMFCWLVGMKYTMVSIAAILNQLATVFIIVLAAIFLKEPLTRSRILATLLAVTGAILAATTVQ
jgi:drug/metabolite transporter (DMT)-like permease